MSSNACTTNKSGKAYTGDACPHCDSHSVVGDEVVVEGASASQAVTCNDCGATWTDIYKLVGFTDLDVDG